MSLPCWLKPFLRVTQDIPQTPDVPQPSDVSEDYEVIIPCKPSAADARSYPRLVDPTAVTLPLHSTPMDEVHEERGSLRMQYETPVIGKSPYIAGPTHLPPPADSGSALSARRKFTQ